MSDDAGTFRERLVSYARRYGAEMYQAWGVDRLIDEAARLHEEHVSSLRDQVDYWMGKEKATAAAGHEYVQRTDAFIAEKIICPWHEQDKGTPGDPCGKCLTCREDQIKLADKLAEEVAARIDYEQLWANHPMCEALSAYIESRKEGK